MSRALGKLIAIAGLASLCAAPAMAQAAAEPAPKAKAEASDRDKRICEDITVTGSRLATKRYCGTRFEWEEMRRHDREAVEAAQRSPCVLQTTGATGRPSC